MSDRHPADRQRLCRIRRVEGGLSSPGASGEQILCWEVGIDLVSMGVVSAIRVHLQR